MDDYRVVTYDAGRFTPNSPGLRGYSADDIYRLFGAPKTRSLMNIHVDNVKTKAGHVGQVINTRTGDILWESSPLSTPHTDAAGKLVKDTDRLARDAAEAKVHAVIAGLFKDASF